MTSCLSHDYIILIFIHFHIYFMKIHRLLSYVLSINNPRFAEFLPLIYHQELEIKETTDTASSASFLDLYLEFDDSGQLSTKIYDKRGDFNFKIINFPNMCSNIRLNLGSTLCLGFNE
jgi:hypothetical protein